MKKVGYVTGLLVGIPLFILILNFFFFRGNNPTESEIKNFIRESKIDTINLNKAVEPQSNQYIIGLSRRGQPSAFLYSYLIYNNKSSKYFNLMIFKGFDKNSEKRWGILGYNDKGDNITVMINQEQLENPKYGTKDNPIPVFPINIILPKNTSSWESRGYDSDPFHVSAELNYIFVEQYLKFFMPKEEFKNMFKE
ncbi:hypothetical protein OMO38_18685 [Chryseobacterium sp. 09-1422]|jgi:hypothetical protein|uniref:DUF8188 domain-containing protein n=1 Tax=Chryseobacterium kimseyorum TaxID=2984028 RepID=A0ABT3I3K0_9FLAO|nr:hypothetical protein [Chryseobacterium kimseyorum]MCW3170559.1 hypothetical protein [Chryseobacterium kimseyorum]